jgi:hypothetical protein
MSYIIDIGGAPANEDCAQLGQTPDFEAVNTFEVLAYKLAIIARHGMPPAGCKLGPHTNRHDFGVYRTLALHIEDEEDEAVQARLYAAIRHYVFADGDAAERDRGNFEFEGTTVYFKIDYYDAAFEYGSEDPADASITRRVLTIMVREDL